MKRLAVAGLGLIGARHARAVAAHQGINLVAVIDPDATRRRAYDVPGFDDLDAVCVDLDGIILATPTGLHADHVLHALGRGWPVLVEKPIASDMAGARRIIDAARDANLPVLTGHHRRYHGSVRRLREMIGQGAIGRPVAASLIWAVRKPDPYFDVPWRQGADGSPITLNMVHEVDLLRFLLGEVVQVSALGASPIRKAGRIESGVISLLFQNGCCAALTFADTAPSPWGFEAATGENPNIGTTGEDYLWIVGSKGSIAFPSLTLWSGSADWGQAVTPASHRVARTDALQGQLDHFVKVIDGSETPLIDAADASHTLEVITRVESLLNVERPPS